jgi:hypothetical protein
MLQIFGKRGVRQLWKYWLFELGEIHGKIISFCFGKDGCRRRRYEKPTDNRQSGVYKQTALQL